MTTTNIQPAVHGSSAFAGSGQAQRFLLGAVLSKADGVLSARALTQTKGSTGRKHDRPRSVEARPLGVFCEGGAASDAGPREGCVATHPVGAVRRLNWRATNAPINYEFR